MPPTVVQEAGRTVKMGHVRRLLLALPIETSMTHEQRRAVGGENLEVMIRALIGLALLTSVSAMIMVAPRVYAKMAQPAFMSATAAHLEDFVGRIRRGDLGLAALFPGISTHGPGSDCGYCASGGDRCRSSP